MEQELMLKLWGAKSQLTNFIHARSALGRPGAVKTPEQTEADIEAQREVVVSLEAELLAVRKDLSTQSAIENAQYNHLIKLADAV